VTDFISVTDRTESISFITQQKCRDSCSCARTVLPQNIYLFWYWTHKHRKVVFFKNMAIPQKYWEEWWAGAISKIRNQLSRNKLVWQCLSRLISCVSNLATLLFSYSIFWYQHLYFFHQKVLNQQSPLPTLSQIDYCKKILKPWHFCNHFLLVLMGNMIGNGKQKELII